MNTADSQPESNPTPPQSTAEPAADWQPVLPSEFGDNRSAISGDTGNASALAKPGTDPPAAAATAAPTDDEAAPPPAAIFQPSRMSQALEWLAVLSAAGIPYTFEQCERGIWRIHVPLAYGQHAASEIAAFVEESHHWPPREAPAEAVPEDFGWGSLAVSLGLLIFYGAIGPFNHHDRVFQQGAAEAHLIVNGEWYRALTALTLHADFAHVMANAICAFLLGRAACRRLGEGLGWLTILVSGFIGNLATAWIYHQAHLSIGASTAVFGALGLLGSLSLRENLARGIRGFRAWGIPLLATLGMLGLTGTGGADPSEPLQGFRVDIMAHLWGFIAGLILGLIAWEGRRWHNRLVPQATCWTLLLLALSLAWRQALS